MGKRILPPFKKSRNTLPEAMVTRLLGSFLRMTSRRHLHQKDETNQVFLVIGTEEVSFFLQPDSSTCGPLTCDNLCQAFLKLFNIHYWHHTCTKTCQIFCQNATLLRISKVCPEHSELSFDTKFVSIRPHTAEILGHLLILAFLLCSFFFYLI